MLQLTSSQAALAPMDRGASARPSWRVRLLELAAAAAAGGATLLAFAPCSLFPCALIGPAVMALLWARAGARWAFLLGWVFGFALLLPGMFWVRLIGQQMNTAQPHVAVVMTVLMAACYVVGYGLIGVAFVLIRRFGGDRATALGPLPLAAVWVLFDWVRGLPAVGLPGWLALGYSQIDSPLAGWAPVLGVHGITFIVVATAGLVLMTRSGGRAWFAGSMAVLWAGGFAIQSRAWVADAGEAIPVALVQRGVQQVRSEADSLALRDALVEQTRAAADTVDLVFWPESAMSGTRVYGTRGVLQDALATELSTRGKSLVMTAIDREPEHRRSFNRAAVLGGEWSQYEKRILAPFGEYLPRGPVLDAIWQWAGLFYRGEMRPGSGLRPLLLVAGQPVAVAICYEIAFGGALREALPDAAYIVNPTNDSWFEGSFEPYQHLEIARMRASEQRRWLLRPTLTGLTVVIDPFGKIERAATPRERSTLTSLIQPKSGATPYARWGELPLLLLCGAVLMAAIRPSSFRAPSRPAIRR